MPEPAENPAAAPTPRAAGESFVPADRRARRTVAVVTVALLVLGAVALGVLHWELRRLARLAQNDVPAAVEHVQRLALATLGAAALGLIGMGVSLVRLGRRVRRSDRYPPPGMTVLRDTAIRTGPAARRVARSLAAGGVFFLVVGTLATGFLYWLVARMFDG